MIDRRVLLGGTVALPAVAACSVIESPLGGGMAAAIPSKVFRGTAYTEVSFQAPRAVMNARRWVFREAPPA